VSAPASALLVAKRILPNVGAWASGLTKLCCGREEGVRAWEGGTVGLEVGGWVDVRWVDGCVTWHGRTVGMITRG
jgi:hypothetical protein